MQNKAAKLLSKLLMSLLIVIISIDALLVISAPFWLKALYDSGPVDVSRGGEASLSILMPTGTYVFMLVFVVLSGLTLGALLLESIRILRNAHKGLPFSMGNAMSLQRCAWFSIVQMALFIAKVIDKPSLLTLGCVGIFMLAAMFYFVLADLFRSAALLREDNDLTI